MNTSNEIRELTNIYLENEKAPWSYLFEINWNNMIDLYLSKGFNETKRLLEKDSIKAYRKDEAQNGNI